MGTEIVQQLESYASVLLAPPQEVTDEQRKQAQTVFIEFQKTKTPFELCRHILENSNVVFVQFQAAACLKNGVIRDWTYLEQENISLQLINYLLEFVSTREQLEGCVREQLLLVCAIILKRCGIDENLGIAFNRSQNRRLDSIRNDENLLTRRNATDSQTTRNASDSQLQQLSVGIINSVLSVISLLSSNTLQSFSSPPSQPQNGDITYIKGLTACSFILAILNEYSSSTRASDFGLPWIKHLDTKKKFETNHLKNIFSTILQVLHSIIQPQTSIELLRTPQAFNILLKLFQILETILTWNFDLITIISSQYAKHVDGIENPVLQPGLDWVDIFINGNIIEFIFYIYIRTRELGNEKLTHHTLQCLSQLSSLTGAIISNTKNRIQFIGYFLNGTLHLLKDGFHKYEAVPVSTMLYRICLHLQSRDTIKLVDKETSLRFITMMSDLTCKLFVDYLKAEEGKDINDESDAEKLKQAIDNLCDAWMVLMQAIEKYEICHDSPTDEVDSNASSRQNKVDQDIIDQRVINECSRKIFECYLRCHLTQPEGLRGLISQNSEADIYDFEEGDIVTYNEQLNAIGCFARIDSTHSISCLTQLLNLRVNQLQTCLQSITSNSGSEIHQQWSSLNDDIHWLLMIITWTLTQSNYGERDMIPLQLMHLSINSNSDSTKTVNALRSCDVGSDDSKIDPIVKLLLAVFKICSLEKYILENKMHCLMSPQVSLTLTLFITRFLCGYLLPNENDYRDMSLCLNACFGRDSPAAADTLNFLLDHIITKLFAWSSETEVTEASAAALVTFIQNSPERGKALMLCPAMDKMLQKHYNNQLQELSMTARKSLYQLLALMASFDEDLWEKVFDPLREMYERLKFLIDSGDLSETTRNYLNEFCESICGIATGTTSNNISKIWNKGSGDIYITEVPKLIDVFHNYTDVIISILEFVSTATNKILCFLEPNETLQFYEGTISILNVFAKHNKSRQNIENDGDEDAYYDILLILQILNDLAAKDFIDWFPPSTQTIDANGGGTITATQVVFIGLGIIMPLMSVQLLEFPRLSQNYYKLIGFLCEDADRLHDIPQPLMESVMASISHALKGTFPSEIKCNCLSMLSLLGSHCLRDPNQFQSLSRMLEPYLKVILEFTLLELGSSKDVTLRENVANTMFTLICCYYDAYRNLVEQLIQAQVQQSGDLSLEPNLRKAFAALMTDMPFNLNRVHRSGFKQRFETFVAEIQGLLCVK